MALDGRFPAMVWSGPMSINWSDVETEYRMAQTSISALCAKYGIGRPELNDKVARFGWTRNLAGNVRAATDEEVLRRTAGPGASEHTDIVDQAAGKAAAVVMAHREDAARLRALAGRLLDRLEKLVATDCDSAAEATEDVLSVHPLDRMLVGKANGTLDGLNRVTDALAKIIQIERMAYGLDGEVDNDPEKIKAAIDEARRELSKRGVPLKPSRVAHTVTMQ